MFALWFYFVFHSSLGSFLARLDLKLQECLSRVLHCGVCNSSWSQATCHFSWEVWANDSVHSAAQIFEGSCNLVYHHHV